MALSNITVTTSEANVQVDITNTTVTVGQTVSNVIVGSATFVSNATIRESISNVSPILYNNTTGVISFDGDASFAGKTTDDLAQGSTNLYFRQSANNTTTGTITAGAFIGDGTGLSNVSTLTNTQVIAHIATVPLTVGGNLTVNGEATVTGNLEVTGNLNYRNVEDLYVRDQSITLNANATTNANVEIIANRPQNTSTLLKWNETSDKWSFTNDGTTFYNLIEESLANLVQIAGTQTITGDKSLTGKLTVKNFVETYTNQGNTSGTLTFDVDNGTIQEYQLVGNVTNLNVTNAIVGNSGTMVLKQDSVGHRIFSTGSTPNWKFVNNNSTLTTNPNERDILTWFYDGSTFYGSVNAVDSQGTIPNSSLANSNVVVNGVTIGLGSSGNISVPMDLTALSVTTASASGGGSLAYDNSSGVFTFAPAVPGIALTNLSVTQASASSTGALAYNNSSGVFTYTPPVLSSFIDLTDISVTQASASGTGALSYNNSSGVFTYTPPVLPTGDITGVTAGVGLSGGGTTGTVTLNLDPTITTASASGGGSLAYDNSSGVFTFAPAVPGIALSALSVTQASASGTGALAYNNSSGVFTYTPPDLSATGLTNAQAQAFIQTSGLAMTANVTSNSLISTTGNVQVNPDTTSAIGMQGLTFRSDFNLLGLGTTSPQTGLHIRCDSNTFASTRLEEYADTFFGPDITTFKARGSLASPTAAAAGDRLLELKPAGYSGSGFLNSMGQMAYVDSANAISSTVMPIGFSWEGYKDGDTAGTYQSLMKLRANGDFQVGALGFNSANNAPNFAVTHGGVVSAVGNITTTANVSGNFILGNGSLLTGITSGSGLTNAQAQTFIQGSGLTMTAAIGSDSAITTTSDITADKLVLPNGTNGIEATSSSTYDLITAQMDASSSVGIDLIYKKSRGGGQVNANDRVIETEYFVHDGTDYIKPLESHVFVDGDSVSSIGTGVVPLAWEIHGKTNGDTTSGTGTVSMLKVTNDRSIIFNDTGSRSFGNGLGNANIVQDGTFNTVSNINALTGNIAGGNILGIGAHLTGITTSIVAEGTNQYFTDARSRAAVSVTQASASGSGTLAYDNSSGVFTYTPPVLGATSSFGTVTVAGQTNIQATQGNAQLNLAAGSGITLTTSANTVTIAGSGGSYGNAEVQTFLGSNAMTGDIVWQGNMQLSTANVSTAIASYEGNNTTGSGDRVNLASDPGWFNGQYVTFSGTTNSALTFLNNNTYQVAGSGTVWNLYTNYSNFTKLSTATGTESNTNGLVAGHRTASNTTLRSYGNVFVENGATLHADAFAPATSGKTISFTGIRASDVGLGQGGSNFFWPETGGNTYNGGILVADGTGSGSWQPGLRPISEDSVNVIESKIYRNGTNGSAMDFYKAGGSISSPTAPGSNDYILQMDQFAHDGTAFQNAAGYHVYQDGDSGSVGTNVTPFTHEFYVKKDSTGFQKSVMKLTADQKIIFNDTGTRSFGDYKGTANIAADGSFHTAGDVTIDGRLKLPNYTTTEINALGTPVAGDTVFNTTESTICFYTGSAWHKVTSTTL